MNHLVLKTKEVHSKTEDGKKNAWTFTTSTFIPTHQQGVCNEMTILYFARTEFMFFFTFGSSFFCWCHFCSSLGLFSLNHLHCNLDLVLAPKNESVASTLTNKGLAGLDRQNSVSPENAEHLQPLIHDMLRVSRVTGNRICEVSALSGET